ncbi:hypothetical protein EV421DRAFT_1778251 [Armillaria borealis]|uniref:Uncharacterized protein n=1 Tax=Armillaria borealis TaxID=47425 RepID=A0AA39JWR4_9AGAR|nr:hypothetical protein EV421DRAFT_1778251 [Armillaria borealis]
MAYTAVAVPSVRTLILSISFAEQLTQSDNATVGMNGCSLSKIGGRALYLASMPARRAWMRCVIKINYPRPRMSST